MDSLCHRFRDIVVYEDKFDTETSQLEQVSKWIYNLVFYLRSFFWIIKCFLDNTKRQRRCIDHRKSKFWQYISKPTDVVKMSVTEHYSFEFVLIFFDIRNIRDDIICTKFFFSCKFHTRIDHDHIIFIFDEDTLTYLLQTEQTSNSYRFFSFFDESLGISNRLGRL